MSIAKKYRGKLVVGDLEVLDDLVIDDDVTITGDIAIAGTFAVGSDGAGTDFAVYGDVASYTVHWDADADTNGTWYFGDDDYGVDVFFRSQTAGDYIQFDASGSELIVEDIKINIMDDTVLAFGDGEDATIQYDENGNDDLQITGTVGFDGNVNFGIDGTGVDATFFGDTANYKTWWDQNGDTNGAWYFGADTYGLLVTWYSARTGGVVLFDPDGDTNGQVSFGASGGSKGIEVILYGDTSGAYVQWDRSTDDLILAGAARLLVGADGAGCDAILYGDTASYAVTWDADGDTNGSLALGADTYGIMATFYGDTTGCVVKWDPSGDTNGQWDFGASGGSKGVDVMFYGDTSGAYVQWDRSADDMIFSGAAQLLVSSGALSVGADATAGTITLYPSTTTQGTTTFTMTDNTGDTTTNINVAAQGGARTYTVPDAGADAAFLMTDSYKTWWPISLGVVGEDTDGAGTNGAGMAGGDPDLTTNQFNDSGGTVYVKVYDHGTTTWDDLSTSSNLTGWANDYQLTADAASEAISDAFAIGFDNEFCEICFDDLATGNGALATYSNDAGKWQYSTGAGTWSDLTVYDGTDSTANDGKRPLQQAGAVSFAPPSDWATATYDSQEAYWIQWVFTAAELTQSPIIDDTNKDEPFVVIPNSDTFDAPFKATIGKVRVTDMGATLHDQAIKFVVGNFTDGTFTEEFTWTASQRNDTFTPSSPLAVDADDLVGVCITDDGGSTNNPAFNIELEATYLN